VSHSPLVHRNLTVTNRTAREIAGFLTDGLLTVDTPYQRTSVWTLDQRRNLIRSWLLGVPIPAVLVNDRSAGPWTRATGRPDEHSPVLAAIDGRQRIETAQMWFGGTLGVPSTWFPADDLTVDNSYGGLINYRDLTRAARSHMALSRAFQPIAEAQLATLAEEAEVYLLVNSAGTSQTAEDLARAAAIAGKDVQP
jgi:hypothetical protein